MTVAEAAALGILGNRDRRFLAAIVRVISGRATVEDHEALPERHAGEALLCWACRCRISGAGDELSRLEAEAAAQLARAAALQVVPVPLFGGRFPRLLAAIPDPPPLLWLRGQVEVLSAPAIAIVGSRAATPYGLAMAARLATDLAQAGCVIVSGLARGVDSAAHAATVSTKGRTIGVLGCGIDRMYPAEHRDLASEMELQGAVVSEFPPGVPPLQHHFPLRNRIISGLSVAVVVVEAPEKSGALITAGAALEQGRDVLVVPGPATGGRNRGGHQLIRDGAKVVESAADILQEIGGVFAVEPAAQLQGVIPESMDFTVDEVAATTGESPSVVLARLLDLELDGRIKRIGGGRFVRA